VKLVASKPVAPLEPAEDDPFAAFASETAPPPSLPVPKVPIREQLARVFGGISVPWGRLTRRVAIVTLSVAVLTGGGYVGIREVRTRLSAAPQIGRLTVTSNPAGAEVLVDGAKRGITPLSLEVPVGAHRLTVRSGEMSKDLQLSARPNVELAQHIELAAAVAETGSLSVVSDPAGLRVTVDGTPRGVTPLVVEQLAPGTHTVSLTGRGATAERSVVVQAGSTASLVISRPAEPGGGVGTVIISSPVEVNLFQGDTLIGNSRTARLMLPAGSHTLIAANDALGFRRNVVANVTAGGTVRIALPLPNGTLSVNAQPWAEVVLDGKSLGETPIGNISLPIGAHELTLKHPQFGERTQTVTVIAGKPTRVGVDMRR